MEREVSYFDEHLQRQISGRYSVTRGGLLTVRSAYGSKSTQVGGSPQEVIARMLLRELANAEFKDLGIKP